MAIYKRSLMTLAVLVALLAIKQTSGLCQFDHPQTVLCRANFVFKGKVLDTNVQMVSENEDSSPSIYRPRYIKVRLSRVFKWAKGIKMGRGFTVLIQFQSPYRPMLEVGRVYALSGFSSDGELFMNSCSWKSKWNELTRAQRLGIARNYYQIFCQCQIKNCHTASCLKDAKVCTWNPGNQNISDQRVNESICVSSRGGRCRWKDFKVQFAAP